jgi:nitrite reductase/ring-hydroxylating ferredoxin subunit
MAMASIQASDDRSLVRLCRLVELPLGGARGFDPNGCGEDTVLLLRRDAAVLAFINSCPHQGARLEYRKDAFMSSDGKYIICHAHGARFDPETGLCVLGPCRGASLQSVPCWVEEDWVFVRAEPSTVNNQR